MSIVGDRIKQSREALQMTQSDLASKSGLTPAAISQFETGDRDPALDSLNKLADALEVSVDFLIGRTEDLKDVKIEALFRNMKNLKPEDQKFFQEMYNFLKEKNKIQSKKKQES